jgi:hypothetical protein
MSRAQIRQRAVRARKRLLMRQYNRLAVGTEYIRAHSPDWWEDRTHENGNYDNICNRCKCRFVGHKRRVLCRQCFMSMKPPLSIRTPKSADEIVTVMQANGRCLVQVQLSHNPLITSARDVERVVRGPDGEWWFGVSLFAFQWFTFPSQGIVWTLVEG